MINNIQSRHRQKGLEQQLLWRAWKKGLEQQLFRFIFVAIVQPLIGKFQEDLGKELGTAIFLEGWENGLGIVALPVRLPDHYN